MKKKLKRNLFSLVELMVVIVIIGLLGGIVGVNVFKKVADAKIAATRASIVEYNKAIDIYFMDTGKYPGTLSDLNAKPESVKGWKGPYIKDKIKDDVWNNPFVLNTNTNDKNTPYLLYSYGPDGMDGGGDDVYASEDQEGSTGGSGTSSSGGGKAPTTDEPTDSK